MNETTVVQHLVEVGSADGSRWEKYGTWPEDQLDAAEKEFVRIGQLPGRRTRLSRVEITTKTTICAGG